MKSTIFLVLFFFASSLLAFSQSADQIVIKKKRYYLNDKQLSNKELKATLLSQEECVEITKKAATYQTVGSVLAGTGAVLALGGAVAMAIDPPKEKEGPLPGFVDNDDAMKKLTPVLIGGGLVLAGAPFLFLSRKYFNEGITIYNSKNASAGNYYERKIEFGFTASGVGLVYRF